MTVLSLKLFLDNFYSNSILLKTYTDFLNAIDGFLKSAVTLAKFGAWMF